MVAATVDGLRVVSVYAPNGRVVGSPFYAGKLAWFERLGRWIDDEVDAGRGGIARRGRRLQRRADRHRCLGPARRPRRHARVRAGTGRHRGPCATAASTDAYRARHDEPGRYSWWDYRAGMFHKNFGMRIDLLLVGADVAGRLVDAEIDREARKGPPVPSDHAPVSIDLDEPGAPLKPDWEGALARIAKRSRRRRPHRAGSSVRSGRCGPGRRSRIVAPPCGDRPGLPVLEALGQDERQIDLARRGRRPRRSPMISASRRRPPPRTRTSRCRRRGSRRRTAGERESMPVRTQSLGGRVASSWWTNAIRSLLIGHSGRWTGRQVWQNAEPRLPLRTTGRDAPCPTHRT